MFLVGVVSLSHVQLRLISTHCVRSQAHRSNGIWHHCLWW